MNFSRPLLEAPTDQDRIKQLLANHADKLSLIADQPGKATLLSQSELTLQQIQEALGLETVKQITLKPTGDGFGGNMVNIAIQTNNPNVFIKNSVRERNPGIGSTTILYYGNDSGELKRYQQNFAEEG